MKYGLYSMRDDLTGFLVPTADSNDSTAMRNFMFAIQKPDSVMNAKPQDFSLYKVGVFDSEIGIIEEDRAGDYPILLCRGDSFVKRDPREEEF